jgi:hypothetical protein
MSYMTLRVGVAALARYQLIIRPKNSNAIETSAVSRSGYDSLWTTTKVADLCVWMLTV